MPDSTMLQSEDLQERYERYEAKIKNFTIMNDIFINKILLFAIGGNPLPLGGGRSLVNL